MVKLKHRSQEKIISYILEEKPEALVDLFEKSYLLVRNHALNTEEELDENRFIDRLQDAVLEVRRLIMQQPNALDDQKIEEAVLYFYKNQGENETAPFEEKFKYLSRLQDPKFKREKMTLIGKYLIHMPTACRELLYLHYGDGLSAKRIAELEEKDVKKVEEKLQRCFQKMELVVKSNLSNYDLLK